MDVVGSTSATVEAEILAAGCQALTQLGFDEYTLKLNHRQVLFGLMEAAGIPVSRHMETTIAIDKLDKIGPDGVEKELVQRGTDPASVGRLMPLLGLGHDDPDHVLSRLRDACKGNQAARDGIANLKEILGLLAAGPAAGRVRIDPYLARGLAYYTGPIFEMASEKLGVSLAGGGRYDELIGQFIGQDIPASGLSLGLERLLTLMEEPRYVYPYYWAPFVLAGDWR